MLRQLNTYGVGVFIVQYNRQPVGGYLLNKGLYDLTMPMPIPVLNELPSDYLEESFIPPLDRYNIGQSFI